MDENIRHNLPTLTLPQFSVRFRQENGKNQFFDVFRRQWITFSPEEWVRIQFLLFLVDQKQYPAELIGVEKSLTFNKLTKRLDAVVFGKNGLPLILLEFKKTSVTIDEKVFLQAATYNSVFQAPYLILSNGIRHFCLRVDAERKKIEMLPDIPDWNTIEI